MQPNRRIVVGLPLTELWDADGPLKLERKRPVGGQEIADLLQRGPVKFVLADCGQPLKWISAEDCSGFWKDETKHHLVEPDAAEVGFQLEDFPGDYCYVGAEWKGGFEPVVLLEKYH